VTNPISANTDPWSKILDLLNRCCARGNKESHPSPTTKMISAQASRKAPARERHNQASRDTQGFRACVTINVLELTDSSATIGWYDSTRCRYEDQHWRRFKALHAGVCAMTGAPIAVGADVFHPAGRTRGIAANADAMILTRALQCAAADLI
jgi:Domain of unknown function (DUF3331)